MTMRLLLAAALAACAIAAPAFAQENFHESLAQEDFIRGGYRLDAEEQLRLGNRYEARQICAGLVDNIEHTRWRPIGELADQLAWAKRCAADAWSDDSGNVDRVPIPPKDYKMTPAGAVIYITGKLNDAFKIFGEVTRVLPYDPKHDVQFVSRDIDKADRICAALEPDAANLGEGAVGLVLYCRGFASMLRARTVVPPQSYEYCGLFSRALEDIAMFDPAQSPLRTFLESANSAILRALSGPDCKR